MKINVCKYTVGFAFIMHSLTGFSQSNTPLSYNPGNPPSLSLLNGDYARLQDYSNMPSYRNYVRTYSPQQETTNSALVTLANQASIPCVANTNYFDGLNKPFQSIRRYSSPFGFGRDMVQQYTYDMAGRQDFQYLPYPDGSTTGKLKLSVKSNTHTYFNAKYQGYKPYDKITYENNERGRVLQVLGAGGLTNKTYFYQPYLNSKGSVIRWTVGNNNNSQPVNNGNFADADLFRTTVRGADGDSIHVYADKSGKVVMKAEMVSYVSGTVTFAKTYYVYDDFDQLRWIIPPEATAQILSNVSSFWPSIFEGYCFSFYYDSRGRLIEKKVPGKDVEYFAYDNRNRQIARQDGNLRQYNRWEFTIYDGLDRKIATGVESAITTMSAWANVADGTTTSSDPNNLVYYYTAANNLFHSNVPNNLSSGNATVYNHYYYDDYSAQNLNGKTFIASYNGKLTGQSPYAQYPSANDIARGELTGVSTLVPDQNSYSYTPTWLTTAYFYDDQNRLIQSQADNHTGGYIHETNQYDFSGTIVSSVQQIYNPHAASPIPSEPSIMQFTSIVKKYTKNYQYGIVTALDQSINNYPFTNIFDLSFDELGRVSNKALGGSTAVNFYSYNIQNWLTGINSDYFDNNFDKAFFKEKICYNQGFVESLYSGDISGIIWQGYGASSPKRFYGYEYDKLHRLKHAEFGQWNNTISDWDKSQIDFTASGITYDLNGNIKTMNQRGPGSTGPVDMDQMIYNYQSRSNRLSNVTDYASVATTNPDFKDDPSQSSNDYAYDNNGNITTDANRNISALAYNYLNQPKDIIIPGKGNVYYVYDANGIKLKKIVLDNVASTTTVTDYLGPMVFENNEVKYIAHDEGRARVKPFPSPLPNDPPPADFKYEYYTKDHLGNVRSTVTSELVPITDYWADHEVANANFENAVFDNIDPVRDYNPSSTNPGDIMAAQLDGTDPNRIVGTTIMLKVMAGDKFGLAVNTYFDEQGDYGETLDGNTLFNTLLSTLTGGTTYSGTPVSELPENINIIQNTLGNPQNANAYNQLLANNTAPGMPAAHLNYLLFDEEFNLISDNSGVLQFGDVPGQWNTVHTASEVEVAQNGYLVAYVENGSNFPSVWADKFNLKFYKGAVLQEDHYYPFGLTLSTNPANPADKNYIKYNSKELQRDEFTDANGNKSGLELYDYGARMMDPQIGRWMQIDPMADIYHSVNPYAYVSNKPIVKIDPNGMNEDWYEKPNENGTTDVIFVEGNAPTVERNGETYTNIGSEVDITQKNGQTFHGDKDGNGSVAMSEVSCTAGRVAQSNTIADAVFSNSNSSGTDAMGNSSNATTTTQQEARLESNYVKVNFDKYANNPINPKLSSYFSRIMKLASLKGITSVNISATTNHPSNPRSAHQKTNGARAVDINYINNIHVSTQNPYVPVLQKIIQGTPGWRENYGPSIIQKMNNGTAIQAPWARDIKGGHYDHIHISVPW
jgi:RHS repeat-associated protein